MNRRNFLKSGLAGALSLGRGSNLAFGSISALALPTLGYAQTGTPTVVQAGLVTRLSIPLSNTPGRIGFYIDYSELDAPGEHIFYVARTHGTRGEVTANFQSYGDDHQAVRGTLNWKDGEADIKSIRVTVPSKNPGEHRIYMQLSDPGGGAVLHFGQYTRAHGVIDDNSVPPNSDAVFYDADATENGNGTAASPYNNLKAAITDVESSTKRYLCGRGTTVVDDSFDREAIYSTSSFCIVAPRTRTGESDRLVIRAWPGFTWRITGEEGNTRCMAFIAKGNESYHTYRKIQIDNLNSRDGSPSSGIWYHYGDHKECTFEYLNIFEIDGEENQAGISFYGDNESYDCSAKVWRCDIHHIRRFTDNVQGSSAGSGVLSYDGVNISVQRCQFGFMNAGLYQKRMTYTGQVSINSRFNIFNGCEIDYGRSGDQNASHSYTIVQGCIFNGVGGSASTDTLSHKTQNENNLGTGHWWCNNVFYNVGSGAQGAIYMELANDAIVFNNIFHSCSRAWTELTDESDSGNDIAYADYNHIHNLESNVRYMWRGRDYNSKGDLFRASGLANNDSEGDPLFEDPARLNFVLRAGSPAIGTGVSGSNKGAYLTGIEKIGPNDTVVLNRIQAVEGFSAT